MLSYFFTKVLNENLKRICENYQSFYTMFSLIIDMTCEFYFTKYFEWFRNPKKWKKNQPNLVLIKIL